ncbi:MAG: hypothetical protein KatS3mg043_1501 [Rhodothermaceae bacterium]|nr:MAG: hypothetical protein KatS3mg043_1501 [Rhodothermaceae bacterium]
MPPSSGTWPASGGLTVEAVEAAAGGRVWTGQDALHHGLVDVLGGLETALGLAAERAGLAPDRYRIRELPRPKTLIEVLGTELSAGAATLWRHLRMTSPERALLEQARTAGRLLREHGTVQARLPFDLAVH